jgi:hypothetical protein
VGKKWVVGWAMGGQKSGAKKTDENRSSTGPKSKPRQAQTPAHPPSPILRQSFFKFIGLERFLLLHL